MSPAECEKEESELNPEGGARRKTSSRTMHREVVEKPVRERILSAGTYEEACANLIPGRPAGRHGMNNMLVRDELKGQFEHLGIK